MKKKNDIKRNAEDKKQKPEKARSEVWDRETTAEDSKMIQSAQIILLKVP